MDFRKSLAKVESFMAASNLAGAVRARVVSVRGANREHGEMQSGCLPPHRTGGGQPTDRVADIQGDVLGDCLPGNNLFTSSMPGIEISSAWSLEAFVGELFVHLTQQNVVCRRSCPGIRLDSHVLETVQGETKGNYDGVSF